MKKLTFRMKVILSLSIALVLALSGVLVYFLSNMTKSTSPQLNAGPGVYDGAGNELQSGKVYPLSSNMVFTSTFAETSTSSDASEGVTVQAIVKPENAVQDVVWTLAWIEEDDMPADKTYWLDLSLTDYVSITVDENDSTICTIVCLQAFGVPINLIATSSVDETKSVSCRLDYALSHKRVTFNLGADQEVTIGGASGCYFLNDLRSYPAKEISVVPQVNSIYTISDTYSECTIYIELGSLYISSLSGKGITFEPGYLVRSSSITWKLDYLERFSMNVDGVNIPYSELSEEKQYELLNTVIVALSPIMSTSPLFVLTFTATGEYKSYSCSFAIVEQCSSTYVSSLECNFSNKVF